MSGPDRGGLVPWLAAAFALWRAGARPVRLRPSGAVGGDLDGLILGGGSDVDPRRYGQSRKVAPSREAASRRRLRPLGLLKRLLKAALRVGALEIDTRRDEMETVLLDAALVRGLPVLGICRGAQLINVHLGGTLHQDLRGFDLDPDELRGALPRQRVQVETDSRLGAVLGCGECRVNHLHNQAVDELGRGLRVVARDRRGVVEAIEHRERPFLVGVQWHPEYLPQVAAQRRLFGALVEAAERARGESAFEAGRIANFLAAR